jgi:hypothetical protein
VPPRSLQAQRPRGEQRVDHEDCAANDIGPVTCKCFSSKGSNRCVVLRDPGATCDESKFIECAGSPEANSCTRGICSPKRPSLIGQLCASSNEYGPILTFEDDSCSGRKVWANVTSNAGEPCLAFPWFGCRSGAGLTCVDVFGGIRIPELRTTANGRCNTLVRKRRLSFHRQPF